MVTYTCPTCDGTEIQVNDRIIQELDPLSREILSSGVKRELTCLHCGWSGAAEQTVMQNVQDATA